MMLQAHWHNNTTSPPTPNNCTPNSCTMLHCNQDLCRRDQLLPKLDHCTTSRSGSTLLPWNPNGYLCPKAHSRPNLTTAPPPAAVAASCSSGVTRPLPQRSLPAKLDHCTPTSCNSTWLHWKHNHHPCRKTHSLPNLTTALPAT